MKKPTYLYIFLFFLPIILLDMATQATGINKFGKKQRSPQAIITQNTNHVLTQMHKAKQLSNKKNAVFIGSSRSSLFDFLEIHTNKTKFLNTSQKRQLQSINFSSQLALTQIDLTETISTIEQVLDHKYPPDLLIIELSPFLLNDNLTKDKWGKGIFTKKFILDHFKYLPTNLKVDSAAKLLFPSYRLRFKPEKVLPNYLNPPPKISKEFMIFSHNVIVQALNNKPNLHSSQIKGVHKESYVEYAVRIRSTGPMMGFSNSTALSPLLNHMLQKVKESKINAILWLPPVHNIFKKNIHDYYDFKTSLWPNYFRIVKNSKLAFFDANSVVSKCDYWKDSSHYSPYCYPVLLHSMLTATEQLHK